MIADADIAIVGAGVMGLALAYNLASDRRGSGGKRIVVHSTGIDHTIVNGKLAFSEGRLTGALPGTVLRS